ncbi:hypothetical protein RchiOBHm_Chr5g0063681 [Rosa chinensis]|uniref:Uncharacterized protein n=1 Tax=Rosa chinensis TaxID=74649 RepID=A0A2P6QIG5_ROSCH|nr:hypothetical protein RchiOBHm_Chr5g0063681 [Rosa chinensis]
MSSTWRLLSPQYEFRLIWKLASFWLAFACCFLWLFSATSITFGKLCWDSGFGYV